MGALGCSVTYEEVEGSHLPKNDCKRRESERFSTGSSVSWGAPNGGQC